MTIKFEQQPAQHNQNGDTFYVFPAELEPGKRYEDIGRAVREAAKGSTVGFVGAIQNPGLTLDAKMHNLWLVFKESTNTTSGSYAIVADLDDFELEFFDADFLGPLAALIPPEASPVLRVKRVVYSHNLNPNITGTNGTNILSGASGLDLAWPFDFGAGIVLTCEFSFAGSDIDFPLTYRVPAYSPDGKAVKVEGIKSLIEGLREDEESNKNEAAAAAKTAKDAEAKTRAKALLDAAANRSKAIDQIETDAPKVTGGSAPKKVGKPQRVASVSLDSVMMTLKGMSIEVDVGVRLELGPLQGRIINFQVEAFLNDFTKPRFDLDGLGLGFESPTFSVAGALMKQEMTYNDGGKELTTTAYNGGLIIKTPAVGFVGLASLAKIQVDGHDDLSLFVYAMLQIEAGITFLNIVTITGLALTLGYNRDFVVPTDTSDIPSHPLIALVEAGGPPKKDDKDKTGKDIDTTKTDDTPKFDAGGDLDALLGTLEAIKEFVPIKPHNVVAGIGLKADLVKLIDLFLMPVVSFNLDNGDLSLQLFGTASMTLPKGAGEDAAVLMLKAALIAQIPIKGDKPLMVGLAITDGSYVLRPSVSLEGGLAFYRHKGVMLLTVGGYGPLYKGAQPSWPVAKPVSLSINLSDIVSIKASLYFSLLPDAITFGLGIEGSAHVAGSHFSVDASFNIGLDAMMMWAPFYYELDAHANFAVSVTASLSTEVWGVGFSISKSCSFAISAQLHMWGNEAAKLNGHAELTVDLLFTFHPTVDWGEPIGDFNPLKWSEFKTQFASLAKDDPNQLVSGQCQITDGVLGHEGESEIPVVSPSAFEAEARVFFPATSCTVNGTTAGNWGPNRVGIQMVGMIADEYSAPMEVKVHKDGAKVSGDYLNFEVIKDAVPVALWKPAKRKGMADAPDPNGPKVVDDTPVGLRISSVAPKERSSHAVDKQNLAFDIDEGTDIRCQTPGRIGLGERSTEAAVTSSMTRHRPDPTVLAALGIDSGDDSFAPLKDTDLVGIPYLV